MFGTLLHLDFIEVKFDCQGRRSRFMVQVKMKLRKPVRAPRLKSRSELETVNK